MRYLVALVLLVTLCGCGQVAATPVPTVMAIITPSDVVRAFRDTGLKVYPPPQGTGLYQNVRRDGLLTYELFTTQQIGGSTHVMAQYDTVEHAETARAAATNNYQAGFRRDKLVLVWWGQDYGLYFTVLQSMR